VRRPPSLAVLLPLLLLLLATLPAHAEQRLETSPACDGLAVQGTGFPEPVALLMVRDVRSGKVLVGPVRTPTGADGSFRTRLRVDLGGRRSVEVTAWKQEGTTVIMTARELVERPCVAAASASREGGGTLPLTGAPRPAMVSLGFSLLALGVLVRHAGRHRGRHERA
jgi:hypothetical protein